jgi:hypothetical protein
MVLEACSFVQWGGDGIHILSGPLPSGVQAVADFCSINACWIDQVGGSGIYLHGDDAQVGLIQRTGCHNFGLVAGADAVGFWDDSFFGNLWLACDANPVIDAITPAHLGAAPAYRATQLTSTALFVDCYTEGPGATSQISRPNMIVSGTKMVIAPGYDGVLIRGQQHGASISPALATPNPSDPAETVEAFVPSDAPIGCVVLAFGSAAEGPGAMWRLQHRGATRFFQPGGHSSARTTTRTRRS